MFIFRNFKLFRFCLASNYINFFNLPRSINIWYLNDSFYLFWNKKKKCASHTHTHIDHPPMHSHSRTHPAARPPSIRMRASLGSDLIRNGWRTALARRGAGAHAASNNRNRSGEIMSGKIRFNHSDVIFGIVCAVNRRRKRNARARERNVCGPT